jgi:hypothetical protein
MKLETWPAFEPFLFLLTMLADDGQQNVLFIRLGHLLPPAYSVRRRSAQQFSLDVHDFEKRRKSSRSFIEKDVVFAKELRCLSD